MAIAYQNNTTVTITNTATGTLNVPTSTADGDFLVVVLSMARESTSVTPTISGTWTQITVANGITPPSDNDLQVRIWYRRASSEPSSYTLTLNGGFGNFAQATMMRHR